jgi:hypothetical protein
MIENSTTVAGTQTKMKFGQDCTKNARSVTLDVKLVQRNGCVFFVFVLRLSMGGEKGENNRQIYCTAERQVLFRLMLPTTKI